MQITRDYFHSLTTSLQNPSSYTACPRNPWFLETEISFPSRHPRPPGYPYTCRWWAPLRLWSSSGHPDPGSYTPPGSLPQTLTRKDGRDWSFFGRQELVKTCLSCLVLSCQLTRSATSTWLELNSSGNKVVIFKWNWFGFSYYLLSNRLWLRFRNRFNFLGKESLEYKDSFCFQEWDCIPDELILNSNFSRIVLDGGGNVLIGIEIEILKPDPFFIAHITWENATSTTPSEPCSTFNSFTSEWKFDEGVVEGERKSFTPVVEQLDLCVAVQTVK